MRNWIENELIELINSDQLRLSIPIQFQFKIFQFNSNSIHAELNWIDHQFQFNSWIDPSPVSQSLKSVSKLEQLERLHSEIPPAAPWSSILVIHIRSKVKTRQSQSYKF